MVPASPAVVVCGRARDTSPHDRSRRRACELPRAARCAAPGLHPVRGQSESGRTDPAAAGDGGCRIRRRVGGRDRCVRGRRCRRRCHDIRQHGEKGIRRGLRVCAWGAPIHLRHRRRPDCDRRARARLRRRMPHRTGVSAVGDTVWPQIRVRPCRGRSAAEASGSARSARGRTILPRGLTAARSNGLAHRNRLRRRSLRAPGVSRNAQRRWRVSGVIHR